MKIHILNIIALLFVLALFGLLAVVTHKSIKIVIDECKNPQANILVNRTSTITMPVHYVPVYLELEVINPCQQTGSVYNNTAIGYQSGQNLTTGSSYTLIGSPAGRNVIYSGDKNNFK